MTEDKDREKRLIRLPSELWENLDREAVKCKRSTTKQLEAILVAYYGLGDVELRNISETHERYGRSLIPVTKPTGGTVSINHKGAKRKAK